MIFFEHKKHVNRGFTIVEVLVTSAIMSALAVAGMRLMQTQTKVAKDIDQRFEITNTHNEIRGFLSNGRLCYKNFAGRKIPATGKGSTLTANKLLDEENLAAHGVGVDYSGFEITEMYIQGGTWQNTGSGTTTFGKFKFAILFEENATASINSKKQILKTITLVARLSGTGDIIACGALSALATGYWQEVSNGIHYSTGESKVGIRTDAAGPQYNFHVDHGSIVSPADGKSEMRITGKNSDFSAVRFDDDNLPDIDYWDLMYSTGSLYFRRFKDNTPASPDNWVPFKVMENNGYVGIGDFTGTTPSEIVHVKKGFDDLDVLVRVLNVSGGGATDSQLSLQSSNVITNLTTTATQSSIEVSGAGGDIPFTVSPAGAASPLTEWTSVGADNQWNHRGPMTISGGMVVDENMILAGNFSTNGGALFGKDLNINGNLSVLSAGGLITTDGPTEASTFTASSDIKLKENIREIEGDVIEKLQQIQGVSYLKKGNKERELGLVAQNVMEYFPELVTKNERTDLYYLNYNAVIPLLIAAYKKQQIEINEKEDIVKRQFKKIEELKYRMNKFLDEKI